MISISPQVQWHILYDDAGENATYFCYNERMIRQSEIPQSVQYVTRTLAASGFEAYLVGGCVRDLLIGRAPKDWDVTTNATPDQIVALFPDTYVNNDYGTVGVVQDAIEDPRLKVVEVTPYRAESGYSDARRPDSVTFGVSLSEDLKRRDFTVNAIAFDLATETLVDHFGGVDDIKKKRLKTVGNADERFGEDALRMMRAVRLAAELNFAIESETMASIQRNAGQLAKISVERISDEFRKLMLSDTPMQGIVIIERLGLLPYILPELIDAIGCEQGGIHAFDVYEHLLRTLQAAADKGFSAEMRYAALLHDIGKPATRRSGAKNKEYSFHGHEVVGAKMTHTILTRLKMPREFSDTVVKLVRWHMFFADPDEITLSAVRRTIARVGEDQVENLLNLRVCDRIGTGRPKEQPFRFRKYKAMVDEARRDPVSVKMLHIDGHRIMELSGEKPGRKLGHILHALLEEVLEDPAKNTAAYLEERTAALLALPESTLETLAAAGREAQAKEEQAALSAIKKAHRV